LLLLTNRFPVKPRFAHMHGAVPKTHCGWNSRVNVFIRMASGARGRGGPAREHGRWEHYDGTAHGRGSASPKSC